MTGSVSPSSPIIPSERIAHDASEGLYERDRMRSGKFVLSTAQKVVGALVVIVIITVGVFVPAALLQSFLVLFSFAFLAATAFKFIVSVRGARYDIIERISPEQIAALRDEDLPVYTVLVPVFREANIVGQLVRNLGALDYPTDKLEVIILTEEEDQETRDAIAASDPPAHFRVVRVPKGHPQTKPRACNVGLALASGDYLVIYDAEDRPDPDQLKKALIAFEQSGEEVAVVQAALNYFNDRENPLTRMFTLEYSYWFDYMLPGLEHDRLPIPLGGTSNHFRVDALRELGGWDPYNVTEDADLGIRASALGYRVGVIDSTTMEEANTSIPNFIRQRSRWIKGYLQTSLVHARRPLRLIREVGLGKFAAFALLIAGTPITFLAVLPFYALTAVSLFLPPGLLSDLLPVPVLWLALLNFIVGSALMVYVTMMGPYKRGSFHLVPWALLNPVYWVLHSIASYKALWQLIAKPHYWEKTEHGLTAHVDDEAVDPGGQSE